MNKINDVVCSLFQSIIDDVEDNHKKIAILSENNEMEVLDDTSSMLVTSVLADYINKTREQE